MNKSIKIKNTSRSYTSAVKSAMTGRFVIKGQSLATRSIRQASAAKSPRTVQILETRANRLRNQHV